MNDQTMKENDAITGSLAECYVTIDDERYNFMQMIDFEAKWETSINEIPILGRTTKGNKPGISKGTFSGKAHYNQSVMRKLMYKYKQTGKAVYFDIQVTNEDPTSNVGRQTIILKNCLSLSGTLAKFNVSSDYLDEAIEGSFSDWEMPETFDMLEGMQQ